MDIFGTKRNVLKQEIESLKNSLDKLKKSESENQYLINNLEDKYNALKSLLIKIVSDPETSGYYKSLISDILPDIPKTNSKSIDLIIIIICPREIFEQITEIIDSSSESLRIVTVQDYSEEENSLSAAEKARKQRMERKYGSSTSNVNKKSLDCKFVTSSDSLLEIKKITKNINGKINKLIETSESIEIAALKNQQQRQARYATRHGGTISLSKIFDTVDFITIDSYYDNKALLKLNIYSILK